MSTYSAAVLATAGLVSYWRLGEPSGTTAADSKGSNTGTTTGATVGATGLLTGDTNTAYSFDGSGDKIVIPDPDVMLGTGSFSVEAWIKFAAWADAPIIHRRSAGVVGGFTLETQGAGNITLEITTDGIHALSSSSWSLNTTYHVVATYDGSNMTIYRNGSSVASVGLTGAVNAPVADITIGQSPFTVTFNGIIDEVAIYNAALSAAAIANHYAIGATGIDPNASTGPPVGLMLPV